MNWYEFFAGFGVVMGFGYIYNMIFYNIKNSEFDLVKWTTIDFTTALFAGICMGLQ